MKTLLLSLLSVLAFEKSSSVTGEIRWQQSRTLTFADFRGPTPHESPWAATTISLINFSYESVNGRLTSVKVYASFDPQKSWMKKKLPEVLGHEQLHFDITEVFARKFYHDVTKTNSADKNYLNQLFQKANNDCGQMQQQYDDETDHGIVEEMQAKWKEKVTAMLKDEEPYPSQ